PDPLCSPNGSSAPDGSTTVKRGSVVGSPALSMIVPGGSGTCLLYATRVLPCAILLVARSRMIRSAPARGTPTQKGLVPIRASRPPNGATIGREITLTKGIDTRPC